MPIHCAAGDGSSEFLGEGIHDLDPGQVVDELLEDGVDDGDHGGRAQGDAHRLLGRELGGEGRVLVPLLDSTPDVTSAQGEEVMAVNLADRDFAIFFLLSL